MIKLVILSQPRWKTYFSDMHPFFRWKNQLLDEGISVKVVINHKSKTLKNADVVILESRYFAWQNISKRNNENEYELIKYISDLKNNVNKVIWFDASDPSGSTDFPIIRHVDLFVKKQVLKNKLFYTEQNYDKSIRPWLNSTNSDIEYHPCPLDQIKKIVPGWNIGFNDYRYFPSKTHIFSNMFFTLPKFTNVDARRDYDTSFRGSIKFENSIASQRNIVISTLNNLDLQIAKGGPLNRKKYLAELSNSKVSISPFGYGEICYRDFETFISGGLLIKPSMEHLESNPRIFIPNETYIPILWDISNLSEVLEGIIGSFEVYKQIARNGQEKYMDMLKNPQIFISVVKSVLSNL